MKNIISFEGIDFSGKTTQIELLKKKISTYNKPVNFFREPGSTAISEKIRSILLDNEHEKIMDDRCELFLYCAARSQLINEKIIPVIERNEYVIFDRFIDSTTIYQGYANNIDMDFVNDINRISIQEYFPHKTFIIDIDYDTYLRRKNFRKTVRDRMDNMKFDKLRNIRNGFLELSRTDDRFIVIDGNKSIDDVFNEIWFYINREWNFDEENDNERKSKTI